mmetsp:Transcript_38083/g.62663  ORF Transcript_38083/g.62663 Transcript_38083/m.62663 type:complete len:91 (+) Transcript_38083:1100-1372(+)
MFSKVADFLFILDPSLLFFWVFEHEGTVEGCVDVQSLIVKSEMVPLKKVVFFTNAGAIEQVPHKMVLVVTAPKIKTEGTEGFLWMSFTMT